MNWGKGIVIGMIAFMLFITAMGVKMFLIPGDDYDHHYYEKGLAFNQDLKKEKQVAADHMTPAIRQAGADLLLQFNALPEGTLLMQRPSDQTKDRLVRLSPDSNFTVKVGIADIGRGKWQLILNWKSNGRDYLFQKEIFIK